MKYFLRITQLFSGLLLIRFSISKLFAWPISVNAFIEMAKPIGIDPTFFRLFTGVIISTVCLSYLIGFYFLLKKKLATTQLKFVLFSNILGTGVMLGALLSEFFLRVEPKWILVYIASFIVISSIVNALYLSKKLTMQKG